MRRPIKIAPWLTNDELIAWAKNATSVTDHERRLAVLITAQFGSPAADVGRLLSVNERTVREWIHTFNDRGPASFGVENRGGWREGFLSPAEEIDLLAGLHARAEVGEFVTALQLRADIEVRVGHSFSRSYLYHLLDRHGWRKVVPRPRHPKANPTDQEAYKAAFQNQLQRLIGGLKTALPVRVLFEDEATFGRISEVRSSWAPPHTRPVVRVQRIREFVNVLAAASPNDGRMATMVTEETLDHRVMGRFLNRLANHFLGEFCIVFLDGAGYHIAHGLKVPACMRIEPLPAYSPELNPVEHIWDHVRENFFANRLFPSLAMVVQQLVRALRSLSHRRPLIHSITGFNWIV